MRRAAFVDRDGTINVRPAEHAYVEDVEAFEWLPGALDGLVELAERGFELIVVSNQRGIARGLVTPRVLEQIETVIQRALEPHGASILAFRYCPHEIAEQCACRKPRPGLLLDAAHDFEIALTASWMIGDAASDIAAGAAAGCRTAFITSGRGTSGATLEGSSLLDVAGKIARASADLSER